MLQRAQAVAGQIIAWRRHVHQHPELSFQEFETARFVAQTLREMDIDVQTGVGKTGVVGRLGSGSPAIALRADMDALPLQEETGLPFASTRPGVMHACGHDAHVACLLGAARLLSETPPRRGQVRFLFQPSEEGPDEEGFSGAARMVQEGATEGIDAVVGLHIWNEVPCGKIAVSPGPQWAAAGKFEVRILGRGGHGSNPHQTVDPIVLAAHAILALQNIVSRHLDPTVPAVVTVGTFHGGTRDNIIPGHVDLTGTLRSLDQQTYDWLKEEVVRVLEIVRALGGDFQARFSSNYAVLYNDPALTEFVREVAADLLGPDAVLPAKPIMSGEDFGVLAAHAPGCFLRLGGGFPGQPLRNHHDAHFDVDEDALALGSAILAETALRFLDQ